MWTEQCEMYFLDAISEREDSNRRNETPADYILRYITVAKHLAAAKCVARPSPHRWPPYAVEFARGEIITLRHTAANGESCWLHAMIDRMEPDGDIGHIHLAQPCHQRYHYYRRGTQAASLFNLFGNPIQVSTVNERARRWIDEETLQQMDFTRRMHMRMLLASPSSSSQQQTAAEVIASPVPPPIRQPLIEYDFELDDTIELWVAEGQEEAAAVAALLQEAAETAGATAALETAVSEVLMEDAPTSDDDDELRLAVSTRTGHYSYSDDEDG